jgi:MoaA/NifB/PqqE/SkfB family radical SAM enzyme
MEPIENILAGLYATIENILSEGTGRPNLLSDTYGLLDMILQGEERRQRSRRRHGIPVPRFCIFSVTWKCNLRCAGCYARGYESGGDLEPAEIEATARRMSDLGTYLWVIAGGEPLLTPGLLPALSRIDNAFFFVFTNGTLLEETHAGALRTARNILPVLSIEGPEEITDDRRGTGVSNRLDQTMRLLNRFNVAFGFSTMITRKNVEVVLRKEWMSAMWEHRARYGFLIDYIPFKHDLREDLVLTTEDMEYKKAAVESLNKEGRPLLLNFPPEEYRSSACQAAGIGFVHINADGNVEPCPFSHYAKDNIRDKDPVEILQSDFFARLRERTATMPNPSGRCLLFDNERMVRSIAASTGAFGTEKPRGGNSTVTRQPGRNAR